MKGGGGEIGKCWKERGGREIKGRGWRERGGLAGVCDLCCFYHSLFSSKHEQINQVSLFFANQPKKSFVAFFLHRKENTEFYVN